MDASSPHSGHRPDVAATEARAAFESQQQDSAPPPAVLGCHLLCWIEVELLDEQDRGVPREPYWIKLPDGSIREGKLNDQGWIRLDQIPCGECIVRFPRIDRQFVHPAASYPENKTAWLEIELLDDSKRPIPEEPYTVTLPGGSVVSGTLDRQGRAKLNGIEPGTCLVRFPNIARQDFI